MYRSCESCASCGGERSAETSGGGPDAGSSDFAGDRRKKAVKPRQKCRLARWTQEAYQVSERRAARVLGMAWSTLRYCSQRPLLEVLRGRLRELAATHVRHGYRRLTVLLRREGWQINAKRVYRLYDEEGLKVRSVERKKIGRRQRVAQGQATGPNQCWSADFVSDKLSDGRSYRILTVVDQFTRECLALVADRRLGGSHTVAAFTEIVQERGAAPRSITLDNGSEFTSRVLEAWAVVHGVQLCFIRPGRPVENGFIESFNGRLRDDASTWNGSARWTKRASLSRVGENTIMNRDLTAPWRIGRRGHLPGNMLPQLHIAPTRTRHPNGGLPQGFASPAYAALEPSPSFG